MLPLIVLGLLGSALAGQIQPPVFNTYNVPSRPIPPPGGYNVPRPAVFPPITPTVGYNVPPVIVGPCGGGRIRHADGSCVEPIVTRKIYLYSAPPISVRPGPRPIVPRPRVDYNIVFVRTPEGPAGGKPVVVPPPQQKTLVYVLTKSGQITQRVIQTPTVPSPSPEVFYVNYKDGDNPQLVGGIDLKSALASASRQQGTVIEGGIHGRRPSGESYSEVNNDIAIFPKPSHPYH